MERGSICCGTCTAVAACCLTLSGFLLFATVFAREADAITEARAKDLGEVPVGAGQLTFSADGEHVAYVSDRGGRPCVICNGAEHTGYNKITGLAFTGKGGYIVYLAQQAGKVVFVRGGKASDPFNVAEGLAAGPTGKRYAFRAECDGESVIICDGKKLDDCHPMTTPVVSTNGRMVAYVGTSKASWRLVGDKKSHTPGIVSDKRVRIREFAVVNGKRDNRTYEQVRKIALAPRGNAYTYEAILDEKTFLISNGKPVGSYDEIGRPVFSDNGRGMACEVVDRGRRYVLCNRRGHGPYEDVGLLVLAPNGRKFVWAALIDDEWVLVRDGKKGAKCDSVWCAAFSPDSRHMACAATIDGQSVIVCDRGQYQGYPSVKWIGFSPNSRHMVVLVERGARSAIICDGEEGPTHDRIIIPELAASKEKFRYIAVDKGRAALMEFEWPEKPKEHFGLKPAKEEK